jgi:hypothetical protein
MDILRRFSGPNTMIIAVMIAGPFSFKLYLLPFMAESCLLKDSTVPVSSPFMYLVKGFESEVVK